MQNPRTMMENHRLRRRVPGLAPVSLRQSARFLQWILIHIVLAQFDGRAFPRVDIYDRQCPESPTVGEPDRRRNPDSTRDAVLHLHEKNSSTCSGAADSGKISLLRCGQRAEFRPLQFAWRSAHGARRRRLPAQRATITISIISIMMTTSRTIEPILRITTDRPSQPVSGHLA